MPASSAPQYVSAANVTGASQNASVAIVNSYVPASITNASPSYVPSPVTFVPVTLAAPGLSTTASMSVPLAVVAQSLKLVLSTPTTTAAANSSVTITLSLVDTGDTATGPGSDLVSFDTNIGIDTTYLSFVGGFVVDPSSPFNFNDNPPGTTASNLRAAYETDITLPDANASNGTPIKLGSFVVKVGASGLPSGGSTLTLGLPTISPNDGGSSVTSGATQTNVLNDVTPVTLYPTPEPSPLLTLSCGVCGLSLLAARRRRQA